MNAPAKVYAVLSVRELRALIRAASSGRRPTNSDTVVLHAETSPDYVSDTGAVQVAIHKADVNCTGVTLNTLACRSRARAA